MARIAAGAHFRNSCLTGVDTGRKIARHALANFLQPLPRLTGVTRLNPNDFELHLNSEQPMSYIIETSADLIQWIPWLTNNYQTISLAVPDA